MPRRGKRVEISLHPKSFNAFNWGYFFLLLVISNTHRPKKMEIEPFFAAPTRNRTEDLIITSDTLYHLAIGATIMCRFLFANI